MSKIFVIPDVHLKLWMYRKAGELVDKGDYDAVVMLGDIVDDWGQAHNLDLYNDTFDAAIKFATEHTDTFWCYGNHDVSYLWGAMETGYSVFAKDTVVRRIADLKNALPPENTAFVHMFDNTIFSHGGITERFVRRNFGDDDYSVNTMITKINKMGKRRLWEEDSPIWARPQFGEMRLFSEDYFQVVGHTPVRRALQEDNLLTLDTFSTFDDGRPIGDERFVWVDTVNKTWEYV